MVKYNEINDKLISVRCINSKISEINKILPAGLPLMKKILERNNFQICTALWSKLEIDAKSNNQVNQHTINALDLFTTQNNGIKSTNEISIDNLKSYYYDIYKCFFKYNDTLNEINNYIFQAINLNSAQGGNEYKNIINECFTQRREAPSDNKSLHETILLTIEEIKKFKSQHYNITNILRYLVSPSNPEASKNESAVTESANYFKQHPLTTHDNVINYEKDINKINEIQKKYLNKTRATKANAEDSGENYTGAPATSEILLDLMSLMAGANLISVELFNTITKIANNNFNSE